MFRLQIKMNFLLWLVQATAVIAQTSISSAIQDTTLANQYFAKAGKFFTDTRYDSSTFYYLKAGEIYQSLAIKLNALKLWEKYITCQNEIIPNFTFERKFDEALAQANKALEAGYEHLGENNSVVARTYHNLGYLHWAQGQALKAIESYQKSLGINLKVVGENHPDVARTYNNLAWDDLGKGDYEHGLLLYDKVVNIFIRNYGENHPLLANAYENMGEIYTEMNDDDKAFKSHSKALLIRREAYREDHPALAVSYEDLAGIYMRKQDYGKALEYYNNALKIWLKRYGEISPQVSECYNAFGVLYYRKHEYSLALDYFNKALSIKRRLLSEYHWDVGSTYQKLGKLFEAKKQYEVALRYYQKSIICWTVNFVDTNIYANPSLANIEGIDIWGTLQFKAEAFAGWSQQKGDDLQKMQIAFSTFQLLTDYLDQLRSSYKTEGSKVIIGAKWNGIYSAAIKVALQLFAMTGEARYKEKAFSFAEGNQAVALAQALQESRAKQFAGIPDSLMEKEHGLKAQLAIAETEIEKEKQKAAKQDKTKLRMQQDHHFVLKRDYEKLCNQLEKYYPKYYRIKYKTSTTSPAELQRLLDDKTALLEYFVGDSAIFVFAIAKEVFEVATLRRDSTFDARVLALANSFKKASSKADYLQNAAQLYTFLIKPIAFSIEKKPRWVIMPAGGLHQIPFEALLTEGTTASAPVDYCALPYLIKQREILYHYSATLFLKGLTENRAASYANLFAGFAPVFDAAAKNGLIYRDNSEDSSAISVVPKADSTFLATRDGKTLEPLPHSAQEVREIMATFPGRSRAFLQQEASEGNFKQINGYKYVHVATHGRLVAANPKLSNLAFSQPHDKTAKEDGILYSAETYNLDLNADLLVLSACQTGAGQIIKGEGLMALTRGFLYSGARNIIASLWKVYDQHTSLLMVEMYRQIAAGKSYSTALREAKLKMIANPETAGPQSWAGFVLIGR